MRARVPLDIDLEDRIVFGLTPQRFGYVAVAALAALAAWHTVPVGGSALAILALALGVAFGWGRWRGRGVDHWLVAAALWLVRTRRLALQRPSGRRHRVRLAGPARRAVNRRRSLPQLRRPAPSVRLRVLNGGDLDR